MRSSFWLRFAKGAKLQAIFVLKLYQNEEKKSHKYNKYLQKIQKKFIQAIINNVS